MANVLRGVPSGAGFLRGSPLASEAKVAGKAKVQTSLESLAPLGGLERTLAPHHVMEWLEGAGKAVKVASQHPLNKKLQLNHFLPKAVSTSKFRRHWWSPGLHPQSASNH